MKEITKTFGELKIGDVEFLENKVKSMDSIRFKQDGGDYEAQVGDVSILIMWKILGKWEATIWTETECLNRRTFPNLGLAKSWVLKEVKKYD